MDSKIIQLIARSVVRNYKEIVGVDLDQVEFHKNMDIDFLEESLEKIYQWTDKRFMGIELRGTNEEAFLAELDRLILKEEYKKWAYMY